MTRYNQYPAIRLGIVDILGDTKYQTAKEGGLITDEALESFKNYNVCSVLLEPKCRAWIELGFFSLLDFSNVSIDQDYLIEYLASDDFPASIAEERASIEMILNMTEGDVEHALENGGIYPSTGLSSRR